MRTLNSWRENNQECKCEIQKYSSKRSEDFLKSYEKNDLKNELDKLDEYKLKKKCDNKTNKINVNERYHNLNTIKIQKPQIPN